MYSLRGIPFPDAISFVGHFCQRLTPIYNVLKKYYFVDSNSEDYGILFQRKMLMGGQLIRYILAAIASRARVVRWSINILNTTHQCTQPLNTAHNCTQLTFLKKFHNPNVLQKELLCKNVYNFIKTDSSIQQHIGPTTAIWLNKLSSQKVQPYMYWTISNSARVFIIINSLSYFCSMKSFTRLRRYKGPNVLSPVTIYPKQTNWLAHGPSSAFVCAFGQYNQIHSH